MTNNDNTKCLDIGGGGASSTIAASRNNGKPKARSRKKKVAEIMKKSENNNEAQQVSPQSHSSMRTAEREREKEIPRKSSTSTRNRRKTFSQKNEGSGASSTIATGINHEKPKARSKSRKVSEIMEISEDSNEAQQASPKSISSTRTAERKKEIPRKASTSTRKRRKSSSQNNEGCASSDRVAKDSTASNNFGQTTVTTLDENKVKEKPKPKRKFVKKESNESMKHQQAKATPIFQPQQFIGLYVCKEHNGTKTLGTVISYDVEKKLFEIWYDDDKTEYKKQNEVLQTKATAKDIFEVQQLLRSRNNAEEIADKEKQKATLSEEEINSKKEEKNYF